MKHQNTSPCLIFAHRGANREAAENTRSAFDKALEYAIDGMETDVQLSRDEVAVLWHDRLLEKVGLPDKHIDDFSYAQLQEMNFIAHFSSAAKPESVMTLQAFLDAYRERCRLLIEIKNREWEAPSRHEIKVRQTLDMVGPVNDDAIMVSSFNLASLVYAHRCRPGFPLVYNFEPEQTLEDARRVLTEQPFLHGLCLPIESLDDAMVKLLRATSKTIAVYTCNSEEEINKALELGVDILISDIPQKGPPHEGRMKRDFSSLCNRQFDLLVCGGGIYGAWTAYDAALRGLHVAIVEQGDWASATSSASSKLIHGGLRYLESFDFKLVKKALTERRMLLENAPHRVWPLRFGVPVYADSRIGTMQLKAGLALYDFLAGGINPDMAHRHFGSQAFAEHFPALNTGGLKGGFTYADAQTDDARLALELIDGAMSAGAACVNYCRMTGLLEENGQACGATIQDQFGNDHGEILARQIVYATGQWTTATEEGSQWCRLTKGIHLIMPAALGEEALLLTARSDGRVFFMIPWYGLTLIGTTDTDYRGDTGHVEVEAADVAYLLAESNHYLKTPWKEQDIIGSFAGLRVLKQNDSSSPSAVSRDWELKTANNGTHYSIGGKITSAREDAAHIVDAVCAQLGVKTPCPTRERPFPWTPHENYSAWSATASAQANGLGIDPESARWLIRRHGTRIADIFRSIEDDPRLAERIMPMLPFIHADLLWSARNEMAVHLDDLLRRRMPLLILAKPTESDLRRLANAVVPTLGWDEAALNREIEACYRLCVHQ